MQACKLLPVISKSRGSVIIICQWCLSFCDWWHCRHWCLPRLISGKGRISFAFRKQKKILLLIFFLFICLRQILLIECLLQKTTRCCVLVPTEIPPVPKSCAESSYRTIIVFFFGAAITQLVTEIGKYTIGRLRPHFLDLCRPEHLPNNCSGLFIMEDLCTADDAAKMKQARWAWLPFLQVHFRMRTGSCWLPVVLFPDCLCMCSFLIVLVVVVS